MINMPKHLNKLEKLLGTNYTCVYSQFDNSVIIMWHSPSSPKSVSRRISFIQFSYHIIKGKFQKEFILDIKRSLKDLILEDVIKEIDMEMNINEI